MQKTLLTLTALSLLAGAAFFTHGELHPAQEESTSERNASTSTQTSQTSRPRPESNREGSPDQTASLCDLIHLHFANSPHLGSKDAIEKAMSDELKLGRERKAEALDLIASKDGVTFGDRTFGDRAANQLIGALIGWMESDIEGARAALIHLLAPDPPHIMQWKDHKLCPG